MKNLMKNQSGATAIEYALIAAFVSFATIGVLSLMGGTLSSFFN